MDNGEMRGPDCGVGYRAWGLAGVKGLGCVWDGRWSDVEGGGPMAGVEGVADARCPCDGAFWVPCAYDEGAMEDGVDLNK